MPLHRHALSPSVPLSSAPLSADAWHLIHGGSHRPLLLAADWPSLWLVERGGVQMRTPDAHWTLSSGQAQLWRGGALQAQPSHDVQWWCLTAPLAQWNLRYARRHDDGEPLPWRDEDTTSLHRLLRELAAQPGATDAPDALVDALLARQREVESRLLRCRGRTLRHRRQTLLRLLHLQHLMRCHVEADDDASIDVAWLAERAHYSSGHLIRLYRDVFGETPGEAIARLRHARAWQLVRETDMPVGAITHKLGFESQSAFCRAFKHAFGMTATEARRLETDECAAA
ncbi:MAG TPA: helix-turn-helix transcriptional regulator [Lysobacter sp.]